MATKLDKTWAPATAERGDGIEPQRWPPFAAVCVATLSSATLWWLIIRVARQFM